MICIVLGHLGNPLINQFVFTFHLPVFFIITGYFFNPEVWGGELSAAPKSNSFRHNCLLETAVSARTAVSQQ